MYELIIMGFLMRYPMHGYRIARIISDIVGPYTKFSSGRLYPLLAKLEKQGCIAPVDSEVERQRMYRITDSGRDHFVQLIMDTTSNLGEYQKLFWYKVIFFDLLTSEQRTFLFGHYIHYCQSHIFYLDSELKDLQHNQSNREGQFNMVYAVMNRNRDLWQYDLEYAKKLSAEGS